MTKKAFFAWFTIMASEKDEFIFNFRRKLWGENGLKLNKLRRQITAQLKVRISGHLNLFWGYDVVLSLWAGSMPIWISSLVLKRLTATADLVLYACRSPWVAKMSAIASSDRDHRHVSINTNEKSPRTPPKIVDRKPSSTSMTPAWRTAKARRRKATSNCQRTQFPNGLASRENETRS